MGIIRGKSFGHRSMEAAFECCKRFDFVRGKGGKGLFLFVLPSNHAFQNFPELLMGMEDTSSKEKELRSVSIEVSIRILFLGQWTCNKKSFGSFALKLLFIHMLRYKIRDGLRPTITPHQSPILPLLRMRRQESHGLLRLVHV